MAKIRINGEMFSYDRTHKPLAEMMLLERTLGIPFGQFEADLDKGSARALAGFIWLVWRRNGREVDFADIESGEVPVDMDGFGVEEDEKLEGDGPDPTQDGGGKTTAPGSSSTGPKSGSSRSARSGSDRGKSET